MRFIRSTTEDEMILEFLQQEYASAERYGATLHAALEAAALSPAIITDGNHEHEAENVDRRRLFAEYRGYGRPGDSYFTDFPVGRVRWSWVELGREELLTTLFVRYWAEIWGSSRFPKELAARIRTGDVSEDAIKGGWIPPHVERAEKIREGLTLPSLILVSVDGGETRVVMGGNSRLTSYALAEDALSDSFIVLHGESPEIARWDEW